MSAVPLERVVWSTYCPFRRITAQAEFSLAEKGRKNSNRYPKLNGQVYKTSRYSAPMDVSTMYLGSDAYLVFRHADAEKGDVESKGKVVMSYPHILRFVQGLQGAMEMARNGCFEENENGEYTLTAVGADALFRIDDMFSNASFALQPVVCMPYERNDLEDGDAAPTGAGVPGMRLYINGWDHCSDVTLDEYAAFVDFYERFDLFAMSLAAVQVAVTQMGGIPNLPTSRTTTQAPVRGGLSVPGSLLAGSTHAKKGL